MSRIVISLVCLVTIISGCRVEQEAHGPNIILLMADDLGYGDLAYMGNPISKTPNLDKLASSGLNFTRFYSASPVCSPTRASCLTGRHPYRTGIQWAGQGRIEPNEVSLAEALKTKGYSTGHFGKWHIGGLSKTVKQSYFEGGLTPYSPPWENGFDECFSTESMMPTYNPYYHVGGIYGSENYRHIQDVDVEYGQETEGFQWRDYYWTGEDEYIEDAPAGDDSKIIMDRALDFITKNSDNKNPFLAVIWFHAVHTPVVAGKDQRENYSDLSNQEQHWFGCITAMDQQIGRLRSELRNLGISDNTLLWFCSDNGPSYIHNLNSAGPLRGKKAELLEGGIRVPAILEWPAQLKEAYVTELQSSTSDIYPTILDICNIVIPEQPQLDGRSIWDDLKNQNSKRDDLIFFRSPLPSRLKQKPDDMQQLAAIGNRYKIISMDDGESFQLYDLDNDIHEDNDISGLLPDIKSDMVKQLNRWLETFK